MYLGQKLQASNIPPALAKKNVDSQRGFSERQYTASMPDG
jgi:hypothetical protein